MLLKLQYTEKEKAIHSIVMGFFFLMQIDLQ